MSPTEKMLVNSPFIRHWRVNVEKKCWTPSSSVLLLVEKIVQSGFSLLWATAAKDNSKKLRVACTFSYNLVNKAHPAFEVKFPTLVTG